MAYSFTHCEEWVQGFEHAGQTYATSSAHKDSVYILTMIEHLYNSTWIISHDKFPGG